MNIATIYETNEDFYLSLSADHNIDKDGKRLNIYAFPINFHEGTLMK